MIDICVGAYGHPAQVIRIHPEIRLHVLVDFSLEVDAHSAIDADDFVGTDAGVGGNIATGIGNTNVGGIVTDDVVGALLGSSYQAVEERLLRVGLRKDRGTENDKAQAARNFCGRSMVAV